MSDTPSWQPDPTGKHDHRYWDGTQWTENVADAGVAAIDPYVPEAPAPPEVPETAPPEVPEAPAAIADAPQVPAAAEPTTVDVEPTLADAEPDATAAWPTSGETTAAWPTAPAPAPGAPAPPPPYVPTSPVSSGGGGSKKGLLVGGGILAAVVVAVLAFQALGGDDETSVRTELASKLQDESDGELTGGQAKCVADLLIDEAGEDAFADLDYSAEETPDEVTNAFIDVGLQRLVEDCDIDLAALGGSDSTDGGTDDSDSGDTTNTTDSNAAEGSYGSDPTLDALWDSCEDGDYAACDQLYQDSPGGSEYEEFGDTCGDRNEPSGFCVSIYGEDSDGSDSTDGFDPGDLPDDYEEILADTYETQLGLSREKAECLAGKLVSAIEDGMLDQDEAMSEVFDYLSDCDISMEEIGGN